MVKSVNRSYNGRYQIRRAPGQVTVPFFTSRRNRAPGFAAYSRLPVPVSTWYPSNDPVRTSVGVGPYITNRSTAIRPLIRNRVTGSRFIPTSSSRIPAFRRSVWSTRRAANVISSAWRAHRIRRPLENYSVVKIEGDRVLGRRTYNYYHSNTGREIDDRFGGLERSRARQFNSRWNRAQRRAFRHSYRNDRIDTGEAAAVRRRDGLHLNRIRGLMMPTNVVSRLPLRPHMLQHMGKELVTLNHKFK